MNFGSFDSKAPIRTKRDQNLIETCSRSICLGLQEGIKTSWRQRPMDLEQVSMRCRSKSCHSPFSSTWAGFECRTGRRRRTTASPTPSCSTSGWASADSGDFRGLAWVGWARTWASRAWVDRAEVVWLLRAAATRTSRREFSNWCMNFLSSRAWIFLSLRLPGVNKVWAEPEPLLGAIKPS